MNQTSWVNKMGAEGRGGAGSFPGRQIHPFLPRPGTNHTTLIWTIIFRPCYLVLYMYMSALIDLSLCRTILCVAVTTPE